MKINLTKESFLVLSTSCFIRHLIYPPHTNAEELARRFITFFANKISTIHQGLVQRCPNDAGYVDAPISSCTLTHFETVSVDDLLPLVRRISKKSCDLDPIPAQLLTGCLDVLMPVITKMVNLSLATACVPNNLKEAVLKPLLKKKISITRISKTIVLFQI